jgi:hypothetical protein
MFNMIEFTTMPLHGRVFLTAKEPPSEDRKRGKYKRAPQRVENWKIKRTPHALLVDWSEMKDSSRQSTRAGFEQVIALCEATRKDEFVVEDIAPDYKNGDADPAIVIAAQERILSIFMQAAATQFRELPEHRLSLRRGAFDLRFYLGLTRPTNFLGPDEDC